MKNERNKNRNSTPKPAPTYRKPASTDKRSGVSYGDKYQSANSAVKRSEDSFEKRPFGAKQADPRTEGGYVKKSYGDHQAAAPRSEDGYAKKPYGEKPATSRSEGAYAKKPYGDRPTAPRSEGGYAKKPYGEKPTAPRSEGGYAKKTYGDRPAAPRSEDGYAKKPYGDRPAAPRSEGGYARKPYSERPTTLHSEDDYAKKPYGERPTTLRSEDDYVKKPYGERPTAPRSGDGYAKKPYGKRSTAPRSEGAYIKKPYGEKPTAPRSENDELDHKETARPERVRKLYPVRVQPKKLIRQAQPALQPEMPLSTDWQDVAGWYNSLVGQQGSEYHQRVILPGVERMLKETGSSFEETKILDLACGQGVLCRRLAGAGARVTGVDLAADMLELAKTYQREGVKQVTYLQGDATNLIDENGHLRLGLQPGSFDAVTSVLSIQNMSPLSGVWQAAYQLLKPGGALIVVMMHPCFRIPQRSDWQWQQKDQRQVRTLWSYLSSEEMRISAHPGKEAAGEESASTIHFHRPLQAYINTLGNAGLLVEHCEEWVSHKKEQESAKKTALDLARSEFPMFLALKCRKIGG